MLNKLSPRALMMLAGGISVLIAVLIYSYLSSLEPAAEPERLRVVVAAEDIPPNTVITSKYVDILEMPPEAVVPGTYYTDIDAVLGITAKDAVYVGEPLNKRRLSAEIVQTGFVGLIPDDKRAMTVAVSDTTGIGGFAKPGNYVDIMLVTSKTQKNMISGKILLQNMLLLAVNKVEKNDGELKALDSVATATLAVTPQEAVTLAVAQQQGTLYMMLRPAQPKNSLVLSSEVSVVDMSSAAAQQGSAQASTARDYRPSAAAPSSAPQTQSPAAGRQAGSSIEVIRGNQIETVQR